MENPSSAELNRIIGEDCCIGCGMCAYMAPGDYRMGVVANGTIQAIPTPSGNPDAAAAARALKCCPFSNSGRHEDEIGADRFSQVCSHDPALGYWRSLKVGHVRQENERIGSSSGGMITWLCDTMLARGMVDGVIHVTATSESDAEGLWFRYSISRDRGKLVSGAKSKYYPVELSRVLDEVREVPGKYVLVGIPCFLKAARRAAEQDEVLKERIPYMIGLVCGHLKGRGFAELLAAQLGGSGRPAGFDFRVKLPGRSAGGYGVASVRGGNREVKPSSSLYGTDWGLHFFRYGACDSCTDVFAETADVAVGDAWLPGYVDDWRGNSVIVARTGFFADLLEEGARKGELELDQASPALVASSQEGGLRDRREDILWRRELRRKNGLYLAPIRNFGNRFPGKDRRKIIETRLRLRRSSLALWADPRIHGDPAAFKRSMAPAVLGYHIQTKGVLRTLRSMLKQALAGLRGRK